MVDFYPATSSWSLKTHLTKIKKGWGYVIFSSFKSIFGKKTFRLARFHFEEYPSQKCFFHQVLLACRAGDRCELHGTLFFPSFQSSTFYLIQDGGQILETEIYALYLPKYACTTGVALLFQTFGNVVVRNFYTFADFKLKRVYDERK